MTPVTCFSGRHAALFGLGGSGLATARALIAGGARVDAWDDNAAGREKAVAAGVDVIDLSDADWSRYDCLVLSPGVPLTHPAPHWTVEKAKAAGIEIIGDIELFCRERAKLAPNALFIAITGTNGKSTTTALIAHILREAGRDVQMGGNIGVPILSLEPPANNRYHVIECSSFQIDLAPSLAPLVGVLLNLTPDHIDRHGTMETYAAVKTRLVAAADYSVIGVDDGYCVAVFNELSARGKRVAPISQTMTALPGTLHYRDANGVDRKVECASSASKVAIARGSLPTLRGSHNWQNAAAAYAVCAHLGVEHDDIARGLKTYPGLPHRMEEVARIGRVLLVNDSKATNADAAEKALLSYDDIFWIVGGKSKEGGIEPLRPLFDKVRKAYLVGASSDDFAKTLEGSVAFERCVTLDVAIAAAARDAALCDGAEPVVLLSPACASYDQFPNFEVRGNAFRELARALTARTPNI
jgi:UDP-N-acetylmuramoylalanine--D-glutamate ligase